MANDFVKIAKGSFPTGTMSVYINTKASTKDREIVGKVVLKAAFPTFVKGVWMKFVGINSVSSERYGVLTHDLFAGDEDHYKDGFHQVLLGFGDGDNCHGTYLELAAGRHSWPFYFKLPYYAPATYFDGKIAFTYKLVATLESPVIQTLDSRLVLRHEYVSSSYSNYSLVRIKELQVTSNKELLQKNMQLFSPKDPVHANNGMLPSIMNMIRTPAKLSICTSPEMAENITAGTSAAHCAVFPFVTRKVDYEVLCSLENVRSKHALVFKTELYTEICTRSSAKHAFHASYPVLIGLPNSPLDEAGSNANAAAQRTHTGCVTKLVWADSTTVPPQLAEKVVVKVPIDIHAEARYAAINTKPLPTCIQPGQLQGKILHYSTEGPLFRYRTMLKVSVLRSDAPHQQLCPPVFAEIYILPPRPEDDPSGSLSACPSSAQLSAPTGVPVPPASRRPSAGRIPTVAATVGAAAVVSTDGAQPQAPRSRAGSASGAAGIAAVESSISLPALALPSASDGADDTMQPSPVPPSDSFVSPRPNTEIVATAPAALAPTRPMSGNNRSSRSVRNHGGIANFRAAQANSTRTTTTAPAQAGEPAITAVAVGAGSENAHPNVGSSRTPHAKPIKSSHTIRVEAEVLTRGPAAVLIDRNERRNDPIRTPQRFAFMYPVVGVANAIEGTPIISVPTPVAISTVEYRAVRRSCGFPSDTPEASRGASEPGSARQPESARGQVLEGFQYFEAVDSVTGTPRPPRQSADSSFNHSGMFEDGPERMTAVAMPMPEEDAGEDLVSRMVGAAASGTPHQVRLFTETFNGIDWLASHTGTSGDAAVPAPVMEEGCVSNDTERLISTSADAGDDLDEVRSALVMPFVTETVHAEGVLA